MLGVAVGIKDDIYLGSYTLSVKSGTNWYISSPGAYKTNKSAGSYDAFLVKFGQCHKYLSVSSNSPACLKDTIKLFSSDLNGSTKLKKMRFQWSGPSNFSSNLQNPIRTPSKYLDTGSYTLITIDSVGCKDTAKVKVPLLERLT